MTGTSSLASMRESCVLKNNNKTGGLLDCVLSFFGRSVDLGQAVTIHIRDSIHNVTNMND